MKYSDSSVSSFDIVGELGERAIPNKTSAVSVVVGTNVSGIGRRAFYGCNALSSLELPDTVTYIGDNAFCNCNNWYGARVPNSVSSIGASAYRYIYPKDDQGNLKTYTLTIPGSV